MTLSTVNAPHPTTDCPTIDPQTLHVIKRDGQHQRVDLTRITRVIETEALGLREIDPLRVATKTIAGLNETTSTRQLDELSIAAAAELSGIEPEYGQLATRLLARYIREDVESQGVHSFLDSVSREGALMLSNTRTRRFVERHAEQLESALVHARDHLFEYFGLRTLFDRYLLRHPDERVIIERPQYFFMRIACTLGSDLEEVLQFYHLMSQLRYLPSSPTLFNAGTQHEQLSSCFLLDSPADHLESIYDRYKDVAMLSKYSGGIGLAFHRVRSRGSLIESTNGLSSGIVPWLKTLDASVCAVNQGGKRKGACCVYLEPWHADIEEFLELRENTGDDAQRTHNLNLANWVPDLFMQRVEQDAVWSLFDPKRVPHFPDAYGAAFEQVYVEAERQELFTKQLPARDLYARMMRSLAQTGNGWMTFKDACNRACNQTGGGAVVHLSNLCTEIVEVTSSEEVAVCNLGSVNLSRFVAGGGVDFEQLRATVRLAVRGLDRVIDLNYYPVDRAKQSNSRWRPIGLGVMGLQDVFFQLGLPFDAPEARQLNAAVFEEIYYTALETSADLAEAHTPHSAFAETRAARGELQFDAWGITPSDPQRWEALRQRIKTVGLRNSLLIAVAPTATIAAIAGCCECIEPQVSNLFKRETLSGDFLQINRYLIRELKQLGLWTEGVRAELKRHSGSVQQLPALPARLKAIYRTAWEIPMRSLIDMARDRGAFIDQSQSLNLFVEKPNIGALSAMYFYAWKAGLKTTYYLRSRPATAITQTTVATANPEHSDASDPLLASSVERSLCSLENPETCEACQ